MKKLSTKRTLALLAATVMGVSAFASCGGGGGKPDNALGGYSDRANKVSVVYVANAYGKEWITAIAKEYMDNYNTDTYIDLKQSVTPTEDFSKVESNTAPADLYLFDQDLKTLKGFAEDVQDVWDSYAYGEENQAGAKKIKDKLVSLWASRVDHHGIREYSLPYSQATTYGWVYNKTTLDAAFPDGYTLPRTTDELFEFGNSVKSVDLANVNESQDVYLLTCSLGDQNENLRYSQNTWLMQIMGKEKYDKFYDGRYWDEATSSYIFDETKPTAFEKYETELKQFYEIVNTLGTPSNGYLHKDSPSMDYIYASGALAGAGFKGNKSKVVFKVDAPYFESETKMFLDGMKNKGEEQTMGIMAFPVASAIIDRLDTVNDDATLRQVIDFVDGKTATAPAGVSEADINEVKEARGMVGIYTGGGMVIPKTATNKSGAKDFMRFLASDKAAVVSAQAMKGLEILPYGKIVSDTELGFTKSNFLQEVSVWMSRNTAMASSDAPFSVYTRFGEGEETSQLIYSIFGGRFDGIDAWYTAKYNYFAGRWSDMVRDYKAEGFTTD